MKGHPQQALIHDTVDPNELLHRRFAHVHYRALPLASKVVKGIREVFSGKKLEVIHLRIFSCPVYIHILNEKRTKLDPSGKKGIFVGYSEISKAYRIYFPGHKKIDIIRDVTFDEDMAYNKNRKKSTEEPEEVEAPRIHDTTMNEET